MLLLRPKFKSPNPRRACLALVVQCFCTGECLVSSKKVLIMPSPSQPSPESLPAEGEGLPLAPGPYSPSDMRTLFTGADIWRTLGRLEEAIETLQTTTKSHDEKIQLLIQKTDRTAFAVPVMENAIARHDKDLNQLGKIAHTAKTFGYIALTLISGIGVGILIYFYHRVAPFLFPNGGTSGPKP